MSKAEITRFISQGTFTGKLATVKKDGGSHVVPIWFVLDRGNSKKGSSIGNIVFTTYSASVKANDIRRNNRVSICIDDQKPPFSFVTIFGTAKIHPYKQYNLQSFLDGVFVWCEESGFPYRYSFVGYALPFIRHWFYTFIKY
jgi:PPOX class probable F420-dependent enzyme